MLVRHDATSIFFIFIIRSKGRERKGGRMIDSEFDDRSPALVYRGGPMITRFKPASVVMAAFPPALFRAAIPNLT
jgi:hypothetical protein